MRSTHTFITPIVGELRALARKAEQMTVVLSYCAEHRHMADEEIDMLHAAATSLNAGLRRVAYELADEFVVRGRAQ